MTDPFEREERWIASGDDSTWSEWSERDDARQVMSDQQRELHAWIQQNLLIQSAGYATQRQPLIGGLIPRNPYGRLLGGLFG